MKIDLVVVAAAITLVWAKGSIFKTAREAGPELWQELAGCPLCTGVWVGWAWWALHEWPPSPRSLLLDGFAYGPATGVLALFVALLLSLLDRWSA